MTEENNMTVTEAAIEHVLEKLSKRGKGLGIRIAVKETGCSGLEYVMEYVDEEQKADHVVPVHEKFSIYIDPKSLVSVKSTNIDYVKEGLNEGFVFNNPNEKGRCGCGESFTTE